ncbi:hypothetical protein SKAU_G00252500 [Synaphobranchus kaupii]|uniref:Uncharacterized protein n=1 Tax=Synaphobranchus kaupii TaxID=118154 RepID=A0A9Q1IS02_SYNKA|nr:hypothetical protein SKAU_G00252500 [Synaphobranchus kaupii]
MGQLCPCEAVMGGLRPTPFRTRASARPTSASNQRSPNPPSAQCHCGSVEGMHEGRRKGGQRSVGRVEVPEPGEFMADHVALRFSPITLQMSAARSVCLVERHN